jgi:hypothetical protein
MGVGRSIIVVLVLAGCAVPRVSGWGDLDHGLQLRVRALERIEQGLELEVTLDPRCEPSEVPGGVRSLNAFGISDELTLTLFRPGSTERWTVKPLDWTHGMLAIDDGKSAEPLDGSPLTPWTVSFPLLAAKLVPGRYECRVELSSTGKSRFWRGAEAEWEGAGFWRGRAVSGRLSIEVLPETPKTEAFHVPVRLRLAKGDQSPVITYGRPDVREIRLPIRNGFHVGGRTTMSTGSVTVGGVRPFAGPDDPNPVDPLLDYKGGDVDRTYTMEIFETSNPPGHRWSPESGEYKVLWKETLHARFTEEEIKEAAKR